MPQALISFCIKENCLQLQALEPFFGLSLDNGARLAIVWPICLHEAHWSTAAHVFHRRFLVLVLLPYLLTSRSLLLANSKIKDDALEKFAGGYLGIRLIHTRGHATLAHVKTLTTVGSSEPDTINLHPS